MRITLSKRTEDLLIEYAKLFFEEDARSLYMNVSDLVETAVREALTQKQKQHMPKGD